MLKYLDIPTVCPVCGAPTEIRRDGIAEILYCTNPNCSAKILDKFTHFVSKHCMDIDGMAESTLEVFINKGFIKTFRDLYHLSEHKEEILALEGFGTTKYNKLISSIEKSRNCKLENYITAMGINLIGATNAKIISKHFNGDIKLFLASKEFDYSTLEGFGKTMAEEIHSWLVNKDDFSLEAELNVISEINSTTVTTGDLSGKVFVVTGKFERCSRNELEKVITEHGGKLSGAVNSKTDYLLTNDTTSGSSKNKKAQELNIPIMSEEEFFNMIGE